MNVTTNNTPSITLHIFIITIALIVFQAFQSDLVFERDAINNGEFWRVLTGSIVHTNIPHLVMNLVGLWLVWMLFNGTLPPALLYLSLLINGLAVGLGIYFFNPELFWYAGLSGALYGLYITGATSALYNKDYLSSIPILFFIPGKLFLDKFQGDLTEASAELIGAPVATDAHIYGVCSAIFLSALFIFKCMGKKQPLHAN